jgi:hypothetical protein
MDDTTSTPGPVDAIRPKRRPRETRELRQAVEVAVIDGDEGRKLHQIQSQAVFEALLWLAANPKPPADDDQPDTPTRRRIGRDDQ